jgi:DNA-directed RNA polymerase specialized sigma24 family protein
MTSTVRLLGDEAELFARYHPTLHARVARWVKTSSANVDDACAIAWFQLMRCRPRRVTALSWLTTVAIREAVRLDRGHRRARYVDTGLPPLPRTTPHRLRRTYISIALLANNFDVKWVMSQVGHADSKMTLDVYAQLEQRLQRSHGTEFDRLVRNAREQLHGTPTEAPGEGVWFRNGPRALGRRPRAIPNRTLNEKNPAICRVSPEVARPGLEPGTPRFSVVCSTS